MSINRIRYLRYINLQVPEVAGIPGNSLYKGERINLKMKLHLPNSAWVENMDSFLKSLDTTDLSHLDITSHKDWVSVHPAVLCIVASLGSTVRKNG